MDPAVLGRSTVTLALLLGALLFVAWRQSRAYEALAALDDVRRASSVAGAERIELERTIQVLESRGEVVPRARDRLNMHMPMGAEFVILSGDVSP